MFYRGGVHTRISYRNVNQAIADYTAVLKLKPDHVEALFYRGDMYQIQGDLNRAIADYEAGLQINPDNSHYRGQLQVVRMKRGY